MYAFTTHALSRQLEDDALQLSALQRTIIDLQYRLQCEREAWLRDRADLQRQVDEARHSGLRNQHTINELSAEVGGVW